MFCIWSLLITFLATHFSFQYFIEVKVFVTTKEQLQEKIEGLSFEAIRKLYLIASTKVNSINFHIPDAVKQVFVYPCGKGFGENPGSLWIAPDSTFCGIPSYKWIQGNQADLPKGHRITYGHGCTIDAGALQDNFDNCSLEEDENLTESQAAEIMGMLEGMSASDLRQQQQQPPQALKDLVTKVVVGGRGGAPRPGTLMAFRDGGIYLKGDFGMRLVSLICRGAFGAAAMSAIGTGVNLAAAALYFFIPWEKVLEYLKWKMRQIWESVKQTVQVIWEKVCEFFANLFGNHHQSKIRA